MGGNLNFDLDRWSCPAVRAAEEERAWRDHEVERALEVVVEAYPDLIPRHHLPDLYREQLASLVDDSERVGVGDAEVLAEARRGVAR